VTLHSDFVVLKNFRRKTHCRKSHAEQDVKQLFGFHYQRNITSKFTRIEFPGSLRLEKIFEVNHTYRPKPKISLNSRKCCKWQINLGC